MDLFWIIMQTCGIEWVKTAKKLLFIQKCPQFSQKLSASNACMLATFSMSDNRKRKPIDPSFSNMFKTSLISTLITVSTFLIERSYSKLIGTNSLRYPSGVCTILQSISSDQSRQCLARSQRRSISIHSPSRHVNCPSEQVLSLI